MSDMAQAPHARSRAGDTTGPEHNFDLLSGVTVRVSVEVGSALITLADLLNFAEGSVVELDRQTGEHLDIFANSTLIAKGEIVTVDDRYGVRITQVVAPDGRLAGIERRG